ncbi:MAG: M15 family metallopeptidase [Armatimonadetes bacterium]|nr:M15 family metallopeptidase [Armatimonadota bacterium]
MAASKKGLDPEFVERLNLFEARLKHRKIDVIMTCGYRSTQEQDDLYARGRTRPGRIVTNARGGDSWHNYGLAADYAFVIDGKVTWDGHWSIFGILAKECSLEWGGSWRRFKDRPHVQWTKGYTLAQMKARSKKKRAK